MYFCSGWFWISFMIEGMSASKRSASKRLDRREQLSGFEGLKLIMTADDGNMEPTADLGLSAGYSNQVIQTRLNNDPGAGVNADSGLGIAFVASAPLFELVWSPHKGLSLKCTENSLKEKKSSLSWDVEPAHAVLSAQQSIALTNDGKNTTTSRAAVSIDSEVGEHASLPRSPGSDDILPVDESSHKQHSGQENQKITEFVPLRTSNLICRTRQNEPLSKECSKVMTIGSGGRAGDVGGCQTSGAKIALPSEVQIVKQGEAVDCPVQNLTSAGRISLAIKDENENRMMPYGSVNVSPLEKLESTAENGLRHPLSEAACGQIEGVVPRNKSVQIESYARKRRNVFYSRKGKKRALSNGDANERMSKEGGDSRESIESCNSVGLFSAGKRQWNFEPRLFVGSKKLKRQFEESPTSMNFVKRDSSFMNWIVNMVKGLTKSIQDAAPLACATANCSHEHGCHYQATTACNKSHDPGSRNTGFQTIFESLYCPNTKLQETQISKGNYPVGDSKELVLDSKTCNAVSSICCGEENGKFSKQFLVFGNRGHLTTQPRALSETITPCKDNFTKNNTSCHLACVKASSSDSSLNKGKTDGADNNPFNYPLKRKRICNIGYRNVPPRSLWITRYSPKRAVEFSSDCASLANVQNGVDFSIDQKYLGAKECSTENPNVEGKEMQEQVPNTGASPKRVVPGYDGQNSGIKLKYMKYSKFNGVEAVASVFARRLDASKHTIPLDIKDDVTCTMITCSFCGRNGHNLYDCSEITQSELEDLLRNIISNGAEEPPYLCMRCFQHDHWAVSCPLASLRKRHQSECSTLLVNHCNASKVQLGTSNEYTTMLEAMANSHQVARGHTFLAREKPHMDTAFSLNLQWNGITTFYERILNSKRIASSYGKPSLNEIHASPLCNFFNKQFSDVPEGLFDAIRRLRLSRMNILKWLKSQVPPSLIDGFFVRLRLGKHKGPGSAFYCVACVTGAQREPSPENLKTSISVIIGGVNCWVESQFVSNHDFLEDELMAWWSTTSRNGGKIPAQDHLNLKLEERERLGF